MVAQKLICKANCTIFFFFVNERRMVGFVIVHVHPQNDGILRSRTAQSSIMSFHIRCSLGIFVCFPYVLHVPPFS